jgi:hypothetical protein
MADLIADLTADLKELAARATAQGWALGSGDVEYIREQAASLGWTEVAPRRAMRRCLCCAR